MTEKKRKVRHPDSPSYLLEKARNEAFALIEAVVRPWEATNTEAIVWPSCDLLRPVTRGRHETTA